MENNELIKKAILFSKENFDDTNISLQKIAAYAGFSMDYFNKIFLAHTGFTVMAYVNHIRMKRAIELLRMSDKSVLDIALTVGFDSHEGFLKAFKKVYGVSPTEYRSQNYNNAVRWADMRDSSCVNRFLHENPDFVLADSDDVIDYLLEKNALKYGYLCTEIKAMGHWLVSQGGDFQKGFIIVCDDRCGDMWLGAITDDMELLGTWLCRFKILSEFCTDISPEIVQRTLTEKGIKDFIAAVPQTVYLGGKIKTQLPGDVSVCELTFADKEHILEWADGKTDGYIKHLLTEQHYSDPSVLDYGVFRDNKMIGTVGCGIDEAHGFCLNNCSKIRFAQGKEDISLYRPIFEFVVNDILDKGILPFDDIQQGEYAKTHGGFTANDVGFVTVCYRYQIKK